METIKEGVATRYGQRIVVTIDYDSDPTGRTAKVNVSDIKGLKTTTATLTTQGNSFSLSFPSSHDNLNVQDVKEVQSRLAKVFDRPPQGVVALQGVATAGSHQSATIRLTEEEVSIAKANTLEQRAKVAGTIKTFHDKDAMQANGVAEHHVEGRTNHELSRVLGGQDAKSVMNGTHKQEYFAAMEKTGAKEFEALLMKGQSTAAHVAPAAPKLPANSNPDFLALLNKGYTPATTPAQISNGPIHVRGGSGVNIGGVAAEVPTELVHSAGHAPASLGAGMRQAGKAQVGLLAAVAVGTGVVVTGKALYDGVPAVQAAALGAVATAESLPVVKPIKEGRYAEAAAQVISVGLGVAAGLTTGVSGGTSWAAAAGIEETIRAGMRYAGMEVDKGMIRNVMATMAQAVEKTIPMAAMQTNVNMLRTQENLLKDAGLTDFKQGDKTISPAALLREPHTRDAYLNGLKDALAKEKDPKEHQKLDDMVKAATTFVEIEGRRVAKLEPYMKDVETKLAATMKVQHLAGQFRQDNVVPDITVASSGAATRAPQQQQGAGTGRG